MKKYYIISLIVAVSALIIHFLFKSKDDFTIEDEINERLAGRI